MNDAGLGEGEAEVRAIRDAIADALPEQAAALRLETTRDSGGKYTGVRVEHATWPLRAEIIAARVRAHDGSALPPYLLWMRRGRGAYEQVRLPDPDAAVARLADWLRESDRAFAAARDALLAEPVLTDAALAPLRALARARREASEALVEVAEPLRDGGDDPEFVRGMRRRIARHFPRDPRGRLALGVKVLLAARDADVACGKPHVRSLWYAAVGPALRRDPQTVRVDWHWCITETHAHRWERTPWLWDPDAAARATDAERFGVTGLPWERLGLAEREANLRALERDDTHAGRVGRTLLLQDAARLGEALALWDVRPAPEVSLLLDGAGEPDDARAVREAVRGAAPWRFAEIVADEGARLALWRAAKKGRPKKPVRLALRTLPHEVGASRTRLFLGAHPEGAAELFLESTASEARLPLALWERPAEIDLRRFGLTTETETA